jgi:hypothetical protein
MMLGLLLAIPAIALADNVQNDVVAGGNDTIVAGGSTTIQYRIASNNGDGETGCNATVASPATVTVNAPAGVTATPASRTFSSCGTFQSVALSSSVVGNHDITVSVSDGGAGSYNTSPANFTLHVTSPPPPTNTAPTLTLPSNPTAEATGPGGAAVSFNATANDAQDGPLTPTCTPASGSTFPLGSTQVDCSVKDSGGLTTSGFFAVTVVDTTKPVIAAHGAVTAEATGPDGANVSYTSPGTTDAVDGPGTATCLPASDTKFALGETTVTCNATDAAGNQATATTFKVTVADTTKPELKLPENITEEATGPSGAAVSFNATASDAVDPNVNVTCDPASGSTFALGTTTVDCKATDAANNTATGSFTVTVQDTTKPELTLPDNITEEATGPNGNVVTYSASAEDLVSGSVNVDCTPNSGSTFAITTTTVNCSATDAANNTAEGSFTVTVEDTTAPVIASHTDVNATATSANGANVTYTSPGTTDAVDGPGTANCTPASGTTFAVGSTTVTCNATDDAGNNATPTTFKVNVSYGWSNFLQPINVPPATQSIFKMGSTVPVKFQLTGASSGITDGTFYLKYAYTGSGDNNGEMESVATTTGTTGTMFRYSEGQYIYNWSTKGIVTKPGNYELRVYTDANGTNLLGKVSIEIKK